MAHSKVYESIAEITTLRAAWQRVFENHGCRGCDGVTIEDFSSELGRHLKELSDDIRSHRYQPFPLMRFGVPRILLVLFLALALIPPNVVRSAYVTSEILAEFMLVLGLAAILRGPESAAAACRAGLAFALAALVRPAYQLLFVPLVLFLLPAAVAARWPRKRMLAVMCAVIAPPRGRTMPSTRGTPQR